MLSPNGIITLFHVSCGTPQSVKSSSAYSARSVSPRLRIKINLTYTMFLAQTDNDEQVGQECFVYAARNNISQRKRNREIAQECFGTERLPIYDHAILRPEFCGKWDVSAVRRFQRVTVNLMSFTPVGFEWALDRVACRSYK